MCFTDGSKHPGLGQTGASIYNQTTNQVYTFPSGGIDGAEIFKDNLQPCG